MPHVLGSGDSRKVLAQGNAIHTHLWVNPLMSSNPRDRATIKRLDLVVEGGLLDPVCMT